MSIRISDLGTLDGFAWLIAEDGNVKFTMKLDAPQLSMLGHSIALALKQSARAKREMGYSIEKQITEANDQDRE